MTVERPSELLRRYGLVPKKEWGQNFLSDEHTLSALADLAELTPDDTVVELGAGLGHFTRKLRATGAKVIAVERDRELAPILRAELESLDVTVLEADAKTFDLTEIAARAGKRIVLCGNLPYHLSSPILFHLLDQRAAVKKAVLLLQKEVAERVAGQADTDAYGLLSVLVQHVAKARVGLHVGRHVFHPPPAVESAALVLDLLDEPRGKVVDEARFRVLVKAAFGMRRKTLWNALKPVPGGREALAVAGIDRMRRGETLTVEDFAALERALGPASL